MGSAAHDVPWYEETKYPDGDDDDVFYYSNGRDSGYSNEGTGSIGLVYCRSVHEARFFRIYAQGGEAGTWIIINMITTPMSTETAIMFRCAIREKRLKIRYL